MAGDAGRRQNYTAATIPRQPGRHEPASAVLRWEAVRGHGVTDGQAASSSAGHGDDQQLRYTRRINAVATDTRYYCAAGPETRKPSAAAAIQSPLLNSNTRRRSAGG